ncbi:MAG: hypothetical protein IJ193_04940 [Bacilli bacterium]|nr:hypothetical protein [Bacilli bacterium]
MIAKIVTMYLVSLYISIPGFVKKAGYNPFLGLVPIVNIYLLIRTLKINPIFLMVIALLLIFLPDRAFIVTSIVIFLPFMVVDCFEDNILYSFLSLVLPFIFFPYIAYIHGIYSYTKEGE